MASEHGLRTKLTKHVTLDCILYGMVAQSLSVLRNRLSSVCWMRTLPYLMMKRPSSYSPSAANTCHAIVSAMRDACESHEARNARRNTFLKQHETQEVPWCKTQACLQPSNVHHGAGALSNGGLSWHLAIFKGALVEHVTDFKHALPDDSGDQSSSTAHSRRITSRYSS